MRFVKVKINSNKLNDSHKLARRIANVFVYIQNKYNIEIERYRLVNYGAYAFNRKITMVIEYKHN